MNDASLHISGAAHSTAVRWGGLVDTVRHDCLDPDNLDAKTHDLLQRLDELAACSGLKEVAQFLNSPRGFSVLERNYLMSRLLDEIYACLTVSLLAKVLVPPFVSRAQLVMPFELGIADERADSIPARSDRTTAAVLVACMKGCVGALEFMLDRERHLVSNMSCAHLLALLDGISPEDISRWTNCSQKGMLVMQPLAIASYWGHVSCVECLLRRGVDVHGDQDCALRCAANQGSDLMVDLLLRAGADVHAKADAALRAAARRGHFVMLKRLLQAGADVTAQGQNAIREAAGKPDIDMLRFLLDALGDVPLNDQALLPAINAPSPDNLQLLLSRGADPNFDSGLPLERAVCKPNASPDVVVAMVDILVTAGADVHAQQEKALRTAMEDGVAASVQRLLYHGANLQAVLNDPRGEIRAIAAKGDVRMFEVLLDAGMPLNGRVAWTILACAAEHDHTDVIELLARRGAPPVSTDSARLIHAARHGHLQLVQALLKRELDPIVLHGQALRAAVNALSKDVVAALLEHGQRVGPAPAEALGVQLSCFLFAASLDSMGIFHLLVDRLALDAADLNTLLDSLLNLSKVSEPAVRCLLDRYAGTLLSVDDINRLSNRLRSRDGPGAASFHLAEQICGIDF